MVKELVESIKENLKGRIADPFIGSFIVSFIIFNYKILIYLFYQGYEPDKRIEKIEGYMHLKHGLDVTEFFMQPHFLIPAFFAIFYVTGWQMIKILIAMLQELFKVCLEYAVFAIRLFDLSNQNKKIKLEVKLHKIEKDFKNYQEQVRIKESKVEEILDLIVNTGAIEKLQEVTTVIKENDKFLSGEKNVELIKDAIDEIEKIKKETKQYEKLFSNTAYALPLEE